MSKNFYALFTFFFLILGNLSAQITIGDGDLVAGETYNWTNDNEYILDGYVYLEAGGVLNIEPGTVIKGMEVPSTNDPVSALIITRDAKIFAEGTATQPIVFTTTADDGTLDETANGLWGGLIILGNGTVARPGGTDFIEGIPNEARTEFGGGMTPNDNENSGVLKYISIRHGGAELAPGSEINGLTLGGVGAGTEIDFVEIFANSDDGVEFFGGTVGVKHLVSAFCGDDGTDYDFGWRGKGQYWFVIQRDDEGGNGGEHDGASPDGQAPFSKPTIYNATYIGSGANSNQVDNEFGLLFRDNAGGTYANSIFTDFADKALSIEDLAPGEDDSYNNLVNGDLVLKNNIWFGFGAGSDLLAIVDAYPSGDDPLAANTIANLANNVNQLVDPNIAGISRIANGQLDPRLNAGSPALNLGDTPTDDFFDLVFYHGAFNNSSNWALGWTALDQKGYFGNLVTPVQGATICVQDDDLLGGQTYNWTKDNVYCLDGYVYLEEGGTLNIEAGTTIYGMESPSGNDPVSALIITRGAQINAIGTATEPIIFTAEGVVDGSITPDETVNGLWGGLVVLGNGTVARPGGSDFIEGIPNEPRTEFGGGATPNDTENSGILRYISIRHGGAELAPGSEINGLTLGGVGSGTEIDFVEIYANSDDGIEWFGGTVNVKHLISAFCGDDGMDYDFGWRGKGQYWLMIQRDDEGGNGGEHDGANPDGQAPFSKPTIYNATYIGSGANSNQVDNEFGLLFRDNAGGTYANSIFTDFADKALSIEDLAPGEGDSHQNLLNGDLVLKNNVWFGFGAGATLTDIVDTYSSGDDPDASDVINHLGANTNQLVDPTIAGIDRTAGSMMLDPRLNAGSPALNAGDIPTDNFFDITPYHGAFNNSNNWAASWTALDQYGHFGDLVQPVVGQTICVQDDDLLGGQIYNWTNENTYCLDGYVYLEAGGVLNIEPGTTIYGMESPTTNDPVSALIITKGAQIFANGNAAQPIIFTAEGVVDGSLIPDETANGLWGGLVILGNGTVARPGGTDFIEGIPNEPRTEFGGGANPNDTESSGQLSYISIRHGGAELAPGSEINGLTLGGVGSGTLIDYVEIFANSDDGIEWFGGTVNVKHLISAFCGDDGMDYDFGWRGKGQYWFMIQRDDAGGNGGEHDGANPDGQAPFSKPTIYNATYIGSGANSGNVDNEFGLLFRDNAGGTYANSIFTDFADKALSIEDLAPGEGDSHQNLLNGDLTLTQNYWWSFGAGTELADIVDTYASGDDPDASDVIAHLGANNNLLADPELCGVDRTIGGILNPNLVAGSAALSGGVTPMDAFFDNVSYHGAFDQTNNWAKNWTALDSYGYFASGCSVGTNDLFAQSNGYILNQNTPNPAIDITSFEIIVPTKTDLTIEVYNVNGQLMATLLNKEVQKGTHNLELNVSNFASGTYFVTMISDSIVLTRKMTVLR